MADSKLLSKLRSAGRLCKLGAGIVTALGLVATGIYMSTFIQVFSNFRQDQGSSYAYVSYGSVISALFLIVVPTLFFAIVLYTLGTLMDFIGVEGKPGPKLPEREEEEMDNDERMEIVPLPADMR